MRKNTKDKKNKIKKPKDSEYFAAYNDYCMRDENFRTDLPALIGEIQNCSGQALYRPTLNILRHQLVLLASRASDLDDPYLNIIMLKLKLYEVPHGEIQKMIEEQRKRILADTYTEKDTEKSEVINKD